MSQQFSWLSPLTIYSNSVLLALPFSLSPLIPLSLPPRYMHTSPAGKCTPTHTHTRNSCTHIQTHLAHTCNSHQNLHISIVLSVASIHNGMTHFCREINKPSLFSSSSRTDLVAAELCQLQGAQILFVAFSSCVYLIFVHIMLTTD